MFVLGDARLDGEKQELTIGAHTVALPRKPFAVLVHLIENRHRMVGRKELLDRFWDGKEVYDQSLSKAVGTIRRALGDSGSELIETRWGLGYRYIGPFSESPLPQSLPASWANLAHSSAEGNRDLPSLSPDHAADAGPALASSNANQAVSPSPATVPPLAAEVRAPWLLPSLLLISVTALLALVVISFRRHDAIPAPPSQAVSPPVRSVAVLPFTGGVDDSDDLYMGLEVADAVAVRLMTVPQLGVRSSATVRSVLGLHADASLAGKKLAVQNVVEGEMQHAKDKVVLNVRLLDSATRALLWSGTFDADNSNIFATEDSIARQVSSALLPQLGGNVIKRSPAQETNRPEAYSAYMKAKFFATTRTGASLAKAVALLNEAIRIDPNYAPAYATLADCLQLQGFYDFVPPSDAYPRAKAAAQKALSLDDSIGEAHVALLSALTDYDWDWKGAEREFKATIAIDPNYAVAYQYYGYALFGMNRGDEGLAAMKQAAQLDPVSPSVHTSLCWAYYLLRQDAQAVAQCNRVLALYPDFLPAHQLLGLVYGQMRDDRRAKAELNQAEALEADSGITPSLVAFELAETGERAKAARSLEDVLANPRHSALSDYYLAAAWIAIGDKEKAQASLDRAFQSRSNWVIYLHYDPRFDDLRADPHFQQLLRRVDSGDASFSAHL